MNVLSLFSGVGGFDYGLENAGMKTIYQCEWDKHANTILERHWPQVPRWGDITTLTAKEILRHGTPPDVVAWGSPCQDLSVAGKRAGLEGERSGLFHEGIRIINELRKETNNEYPRISIWENVAGALSSNRGADFGVIIDEMAKAGAMVIEWGLLDAQHFGIPQRRRRVFCIAIFNSATATNCPNPLLPIGESLPRDTKKGKSKGKSVASETSAGFGSGSFGGWTETDTAITLSARDHKGGNTIVGSLAARDYKGVGNQYVDEGKVIVEPYVKSRRAQSVTDDETWVPGEVNPTLNSFDVGDTRATTAIIEPVMLNYQGSKGNSVTSEDGISFSLNAMHGHDVHVVTEEPILVDGRRMNDVRVYNPPVQTLGARMGTGGNNVPVIGFSHTQGLSAQPSEDAFPTLRTEGNGMAVAIPIDTRNALRDPDKYDAQNRQGLGIGNDGDPMATLTSTHVNAVAYDEYNDSINETHHALRAGTKQSTGVLLDAAGFKAGQGASAGSIGYQEGLSQTLTSNMNGVEPTVLTPTMAVRRLTPLECERLMGWPDDHTRYKADGTEQADTHRYKQCGNGVASPVAEWIGKQLMKLQTSLEG
jgi:DNA (cytosine-5)-methyltransferase 1